MATALENLNNQIMTDHLEENLSICTLQIGEKIVQKRRQIVE